jgi:hypothetical protein
MNTIIGRFQLLTCMHVCCVRADDKLGLNGVHTVFIYADVNVLDDIMEIMNTVNNSTQA